MADLSPQERRAQRETAAYLARLESKVASLSRAQQIAHSTVTVPDGDGVVEMLVPEAVGRGVQAGFDAAAVDEKLDTARAELEQGQAELGDKLADAELGLEGAGQRLDAAEGQITDAFGQITTLDGRVDGAVADASAAQQAASQAAQDAASAQTVADQASQAALDAAGIASSKGEVIYQVSAPTGSRASAANLWIRTTDNVPHTWDGTGWVAVTDRTAVDAAADAAQAQSAASQAQSTADAAASVAADAQSAADLAQSAAAAAATAASTAQSTADTAKSDAASAQAAADQAAQDAITKADAAEAAAKAYADAEAEAARLAAVAAASDDAAAKAAAAQAAAEAAAALDAKQKADAAQAAAEAKAQAAQTTADQAVADAAAAKSAAQGAQQTADNLPKVLHGTTAPAGTAPDGSIWFQHAGSLTGNVVGQWNRVSGQWKSTPISSEAIANLDVGKLTAGGAVIAEVVAQAIASATAAFQRADIKNLFVTAGATINEAVIDKLWADVVVAKMLVADKIISSDAIVDELVGKVITAVTINGGTINGVNMIGTSFSTTGTTSPEAAPGVWITQADGVVVGSTVKANRVQLRDGRIDVTEGIIDAGGQAGGGMPSRAEIQNGSIRGYLYDEQDHSKVRYSSSYGAESIILEEPGAEAVPQIAGVLQLSSGGVTGNTQYGFEVQAAGGKLTLVAGDGQWPSTSYPVVVDGSRIDLNAGNGVYVNKVMTCSRLLRIQQPLRLPCDTCTDVARWAWVGVENDSPFRWIDRDLKHVFVPLTSVIADALDNDSQILRHFRILCETPMVLSAAQLQARCCLVESPSSTRKRLFGRRCWMAGRLNSFHGISPLPR